MKGKAVELRYKFATEESEFEQIYQLNYRTFVEEIPQHEVSSTRRLVDKFHAQNTYVICLQQEQLIGMLALRGQRPFSLDQKLSNLDDFLPSGGRILEVRLLAVEKKHRGLRGGRILKGMLVLLKEYGVARGYDLGIISGTTRQLGLYSRLGFVAFGPLVGAGDARYQPMYVSLKDFDAAERKKGSRSLLRLNSSAQGCAETQSFS